MYVSNNVFGVDCRFNNYNAAVRGGAQVRNVTDKLRQFYARDASRLATTVTEWQAVDRINEILCYRS